MDRLLATDLAELVPGAGSAAHPVLDVILERARAGSRPGERRDPHCVCLAVEGGGMRGAVSAGMCVVLEAAGLAGTFDRVYGVSAGALNAAAFATGQASLSATHYEDAVAHGVIRRVRPLVGRPVVDFDLLFGQIIAGHKPLAFASPAAGPQLRVLATSLETLSLRVLQDFADAGEVLQAIRASAALPRGGGPPPTFRGERMVDGALIEAIPYETALREGATHVLVLRSRPSAFRKPAVAFAAERLALRGNPGVLEVIRAHGENYNRQAADLGSLDRQESRVLQVAVPDRARLIGRFEASPARVVEALRLGAAAMARAVLTEPVELCWQPVAHVVAPEAAPERAATARWRPARRRALAEPQSG